MMFQTILKIVHRIRNQETVDEAFPHIPRRFSLGKETYWYHNNEVVYSMCSKEEKAAEIKVALHTGS